MVEEVSSFILVGKTHVSAVVGNQSLTLPLSMESLLVAQDWVREGQGDPNVFHPKSKKPHSLTFQNTKGTATGAHSPFIMERLLKKEPSGGSADGGRPKGEALKTLAMAMSEDLWETLNRPSLAERLAERLRDSR